MPLKREMPNRPAHSNALAALWALYHEHGGSLRVAATMAELTGRVSVPCLPQPLNTLQGQARQQVKAVIEALGLG